MGRINGLRGEHRIDFVLKIAVQNALLFLRKLLVTHQTHASFPQLGGQLFAPMVLGALQQLERAPPYFRQLSGRAHAVRGGGGDAVAVLMQDIGHPHHEKFVQIVVENSQELDLFQKRTAGVRGFFQHPGVEIQPVDFPVDIEIGAGQFTFFLIGTARFRSGSFGRGRFGLGHG